MEESFLSDFLSALRSVSALSMVFAVVAFFAIAMMLLWLWRGSVLESKDKE